MEIAPSGSWEVESHRTIRWVSVHTKLFTAKPIVNPLAGYRFPDSQIEEARDLVPDKKCVHFDACFLVIDAGSIL